MFIKKALQTQVKLNVILKLSFLVKVLSIFLKQGLFLVTWSFFFYKYGEVDGWTFRELIAMYGIISFGVGTVEMFFYGVREIPMYVETNQIDNFLLQPRNVLLNIALSKGDVVAFSEIVYGLILMGLSGYMTKGYMLYFLLPLSPLFIFSLFLYLSSVSFYMQNSFGFVRELYQNANIVATQPASAYRGFFKVITLTVLPTAYISFFPIESLRLHAYKSLLISYAGALTFFLIACLFFYRGLRQYESSSTISYKY